MRGHGLLRHWRCGIHRLGGGKYRVEGVKFHMSGWWELKFAIASPAGEDQAVFNIVIE